MSKFLFTFVIVNLICGMFSSFSYAANFTDEGRGRLRISGEITKGDFARFATILKQRDPFFSLYLDSAGGDVGEAIKIGDLVKNIGLGTSVQRGDICASACFFIWMYGAPRYASFLNVQKNEYAIGLHRPYTLNPKVDQKSLDRQRDVQKVIASVLEENFIPRRLIDVMMSRSSREIYWLNGEDIDQLGEYTPQIQEILISKCDYDYSIYGEIVRLRAQNRISQSEKLKLKLDSINQCSAIVLLELFENRRSNILSQIKID